MNNLTNEQIAKVFAMYMPCDADIIVRGKPQGVVKTVVAVGGFNDLGFEYAKMKIKGGLAVSRFVVNLKLLLTPLSAISDEDAVEISKLHGVHTDHPKLQGHALVHWLAKNGKSRDINYECYMYLIQKGYAVPLFFEPGHPDNGKTAIELGIAIDRTKSKEVQP